MAFQQNPTKSQSLETKLDEAEKILGRLSFGVGKEALTILDVLDEATLRIESLLQQGTPPKAELAQFEMICASLRKDSREFLKQIGGAVVLINKRAELHPPREHWWWYLDEELASSQQKSMLRTVRSAAIVVIILIAAAIVYQLFLSPDPLVIAEVNAQQNADQFLSEGKMEDALAAIETGLAKVPDSPDLLLYKATILQSMGKTAEAAPIFKKAQQLVDDPIMVGLTQAQILNILNKPQDAVDLLLILLKEYPSSAKAYLIMGQSYETLGNQQEALAAYEKAATLSAASGDDTTTAQARIKMGMLMQVFGMPQAQLTPTVTSPP